MLFVAMDTVLFRNVVVNILENSIQYGVQQYGVQQYGDKKQVELRIQTKHSGGTVEIILSDNGPGVMPEELSRLFDVFYRTDPARNTKGSGLGLAISAKIIRRMNGTVHAETAKSDPQGGGLAIIIRLLVTGCQNGA
jgi:signal transduction histidine kinase